MFEFKVKDIKDDIACANRLIGLATEPRHVIHNRTFKCGEIGKHYIYLLRQLYA